MKWPCEELKLTQITEGLPLRKEPADLGTLSASIKRLGLLNPLVVDRNGVLVSGARRLAACRQAELTSVPVWRLDVASDSIIALDIQSDENLCREPLACHDLEKHIADKKACLAGKPIEQTGFLQRVKGLVTRNQGAE